MSAAYGPQPAGADLEASAEAPVVGSPVAEQVTKPHPAHEASAEASVEPAAPGSERADAIVDVARAYLEHRPAMSWS